MTEYLKHDRATFHLITGIAALSLGLIPLLKHISPELALVFVVLAEVGWVGLSYVMRLRVLPIVSLTALVYVLAIL